MVMCLGSPRERPFDPAANILRAPCPSNLSRSRSSVYRAPLCEGGGRRWDSCRERQFTGPFA